MTWSYGVLAVGIGTLGVAAIAPFGVALGDTIAVRGQASADDAVLSNQAGADHDTAFQTPTLVADSQAGLASAAKASTAGWTRHLAKLPDGVPGAVRAEVRSLYELMDSVIDARDRKLSALQRGEQRKGASAFDNISDPDLRRIIDERFHERMSGETDLLHAYLDVVSNRIATLKETAQRASEAFLARGTRAKADANYGELLALIEHRYQVLHRAQDRAWKPTADVASDSLAPKRVQYVPITERLQWKFAHDGEPRHAKMLFSRQELRFQGFMVDPTRAELDKLDDVYEAVQGLLDRYRIDLRVELDEHPLFMGNNPSVRYDVARELLWVGKNAELDLGVIERILQQNGLEPR